MRHASLLLLATATLLPLATAQSPKEELREAIRQIVREEIRAALREQQEQRAKAPRQLTILDAKSGEVQSVPVARAGRKVDMGGVVAEIVELELAEAQAAGEAAGGAKPRMAKIIQQRASKAAPPHGFQVIGGKPLFVGGNVDVQVLECPAEAGQPLRVEIRKAGTGAAEGGEMECEVECQTEGNAECCEGGAAAPAGKPQRIEVKMARPMQFRIDATPETPAAPAKKAKKAKSGKKAKKAHQHEAAEAATSPVLEIGQLGS